MKLNSDIAEICGAFIGDGWIEKRETALYILGNIIEDKDYFDKHLVNLFLRSLCNIKIKEFSCWKVYGVYLYNKSIIKELLKLDFISGKKVYITKIPKWVFNSKDFMKATIRGIFDTDGSVYCGRSYGKYAKGKRAKFHHDIRIRFNITSKQLADDLVKIGTILGIKMIGPRIKENKITLERNNSRSYIVEVNKKECINNWFENIKLSANHKHITKYLIWKKFGFCPPNTNLEERRKILKGEINPYSYYVGLPEWPNGTDNLKVSPASRAVGLVPT